MTTAELRARRRLIPPADIIDAAEVRTILGLSPTSRRSLIKRRQDPQFPRPVRRLGSGVELWDREAVLAFVQGQENPPSGGRR